MEKINVIYNGEIDDFKNVHNDVKSLTKLGFNTSNIVINGISLPAPIYPTAQLIGEGYKAIKERDSDGFYFSLRKCPMSLFPYYINIYDLEPDRVSELESDFGICSVLYSKEEIDVFFPRLKSLSGTVVNDKLIGDNQLFMKVDDVLIPAGIFKSVREVKKCYDLVNSGDWDRVADFASNYEEDVMSTLRLNFEDKHLKFTGGCSLVKKIDK